MAKTNGLNDLSTELGDIERQLTEIDAQAARYDGGLILTRIEARREAHLLARTLIENRISAEAGGATVEVIIPAVQPDEARAAQRSSAALSACLRRRQDP
jgi:hypothetical protein